MGIRADESAARARKTQSHRNDRMSVASREVVDWLPIFYLSAVDVFRIICDAGQSLHWIYARGRSRCSCRFFVLASCADLRRAAHLRSDLYRQYAELERRIRQSVSPTRTALAELTGIPFDPVSSLAPPTHFLRGRCAARYLATPAPK